MPKRKKTGGKNFEPGISGNPNGRPPLPKEIRDFRNAANKEIIEEFKFLWSLTESELLEIIRNKEGNYKDQLGDEIDLKDVEIENQVPAIRKFMARAILRAVRSGDMYSINPIFDRVIGKVKEQIDLNANVSTHKMIVEYIKKIESETEDENGN